MAGSAHSPGHAHLHVPGESRLHRMAPAPKLVGLVAFAVVVALTPRRSIGVFAVEAIVVAALVALARLPIRTVLTRLLVVLPFLVFAVVVPFVGSGDRVDVLGLSLSEDGLWAGFGVAAKALLGAGAAIVFAATTAVPDVVRAMSELHVPAVVVGIVSFMFRYLDLIVDQLRRMRQAMVARCHDPRWLWQVGPIASSAGTLFVRSYERGERVHQAMSARGFDGRMPDLDERPTVAGDWPLAVVPAIVAATALLVAVLA